MSAMMSPLVFFIIATIDAIESIEAIGQTLLYRNEAGGITMGWCRLLGVVCDLLLLHFLALEESPRDDGRGVGVGDEVDRGDGVGDKEVGDLTLGDAAVVLAEVHSGGRVDGGCVDGLGRQ